MTTKFYKWSRNLIGTNRSPKWKCLRAKFKGWSSTVEHFTGVNFEVLIAWFWNARDLFKHTWSKLKQVSQRDIYSLETIGDHMSSNSCLHMGSYHEMPYKANKKGMNHVVAYNFILWDADEKCIRHHMTNISSTCFWAFYGALP